MTKHELPFSVGVVLLSVVAVVVLIALAFLFLRKDGPASPTEQVLSSKKAPQGETGQPNQNTCALADNNKDDPPGSVGGRVVITTKEKKEESVKEALVYLAPCEHLDHEIPADPVTAIIKDGRLKPNPVLVVAGQKLVIEIKDEDAYSLHFASPHEPQAGNLIPPDPARLEKVFKKPFVAVDVDCAIHPSFRARISVVPNKFYTVTGENGVFKLPGDLPPGNYEIRAFIHGYPEVRQKIEVKSGQTTEVKFVIRPNAD